MGGRTRNGIARLLNDPATQSLTVSGAARVEWLRGGASAEVEQVTFELSTNAGSTWTLLGTGERIPGGWEVTGFDLPPTDSLRARGRTDGGYRNGSSGIVETATPFTLATDTPFRILSAVQSGGNLLITFPTKSGETHTLWTSDSLTDNWTDTGIAAISGDSADKVLTIAAPVEGVDKRFFRVQAGPKL